MMRVRLTASGRAHLGAASVPSAEGAQVFGQLAEALSRHWPAVARSSQLPPAGEMPPWFG